MFRRGLPFRSPVRFLEFLNPMLQRILGEANQAFEAEDYNTAAERYSRLAERAVIRGKPRAGNWMIKAGQASVLNGAREAGMRQIFKGMEMLRSQGRQRDLGRYAWRTIDLFNSKGLKAEAQSVSDWIKGNSPEAEVDRSFVQGTESRTNSRQRLPVKCPSCGAPVHPQTVDWADNGQAACAYCGCLLPEG
ncbi:MAG: hypothetical protein GYA15_02850 [Leptolinea sp.]|jgi:uncharacterized Zn-finger protein|nr:hypothetical protein [Leptolinea sp.]